MNPTSDVKTGQPLAVVDGEIVTWDYIEDIGGWTVK